MQSHRSRHRVIKVLGFAMLLGAVAGACSSDGPADSRPVIVDADEPGPRLTVEGRVLDGSTDEPIEGARIVVYQTDQSGTYHPTDPADESTARIRGELSTDGDGRFGFVTVQPGEYPDQPPGNRHIHFHSVTADGYVPTGFVMLFDDNVRSEVRSWAEATGFGVVVPVSGAPSTGLAATVEIRLDPEP